MSGGSVARRLWCHERVLLKAMVSADNYQTTIVSGTNKQRCQETMLSGGSSLRKSKVSGNN